MISPTWHTYGADPGLRARVHPMMAPMPGSSSVLSIACLASSALLGLLACSHEWDLYDPRLGGGGDGTGASSSGGGEPSGGGGQGTGAAGPSSGGGGVGGVGGVGGSGGEGGNGSVELSYGAAIADCVNPTSPNPDTCAAEGGGIRMSVDLEEGMPPTPRISFLRFDLDAQLAGKSVDSVELRLSVPMFVGAESNDSGEVWRVTEFDRAALFTAAPTKVGASPAAASVGAVAQGQTVVFELPSSLVSAGGSVYLGVFPLSTNGVDYSNVLGAVPPALVITAH